MRKEDRSWEPLLIDYIRAGCSQTKAVALVGVGHDTVIKRKKKYPDFAVQVDNAFIANGRRLRKRRTPVGGTDNSAHEEDLIDLCAQFNCRRLGIWMTQRRAYCDLHWSELRASARLDERNVDIPMKGHQK